MSESVDAMAVTGGGGDPAAGSHSGSGSADAGKLGPGREFDLIRRFCENAKLGSPDVRLGVGDDAAVLANGTVLSSDICIEGVHFERGWAVPYDIGFRAAAAALSDLAAMAATPVGILVSIGLESEDAEDGGVEIMRGVVEAANAVGATLLGGDLSRSPGPVVIDVTVVGHAEAPIARSGAQPGDELWVTGDLGGAALAVAALIEEEEAPPSAMDRFRHPTARIREALWLAERGIPRAMLDLSDGLGGDAKHLATASGVAVLLDMSSLPVHEDVSAAFSPEVASSFALAGGEDYELFFAAGKGLIDDHLRDEFEATFACRLTRVGTVEPGSGEVHVVDVHGEVQDFAFGSFQHFRA